MVVVPSLPEGGQEGLSERLQEEQSQKLEVGDIYLLCSDGLNSMLEDDEILETVVAEGDDLEATTNTLIERANLRGGEDNITLILAKIVED